MNTDSNLQVLDDGAEMVSILQKFQEHRQVLTLNVKGRSQQYSTVILHCHWPMAELVIDEPLAAQAKLNIDPSMNLEISGLLGGIHYSMQGLQPLIDHQADEPVHLSFPNKIFYQQRRQFFRTHVPRHISSRVDILFNDKSSVVEGRILDLSVTGISCEIDCYNSNLMKDEPPKAVVYLTISIDNIFTLNCQGVIKGEVTQKKHNLLRMGIEFLELDVLSQRLINKTVVDLQRMTRKNHTRE